MRPQDYDYELPPERIAQQPTKRRGDARMMVLRGAGELVHAQVKELGTYLAGDPLVVVNDSKVVPARLVARRGDGRSFELLVCAPATVSPGDQVTAWVRKARRLRPDDLLEVGELRLRHLGSGEAGGAAGSEHEHEVDARARRFELLAGDLMETLASLGAVPLPPYITREQGPTAEDRLRYQTTFARAPGSVAAPTAGLHFESEQLAGLDHVCLTLHVGPGTFLPMRCEDVSEHRVAPERFSIAEDAARRINEARASGRQVLAVGTTVTRALEGVVAAHGRVVAGEGSTDLVIAPGHSFRCVSRLLTNFHLPRSSLLMLTSTFGGKDRVLAAYAEALGHGYRFYSYGDCMLLDRDPSLARARG